MGGPKSSSNASNQTSTNTTTNTTSTSTQQGLDGFNTGRILQGESINVNDAFPESVANAFGQLVDLATYGVDFAGAAGQEAANISKGALETVSNTRFREEQPVLASTEAFIPVIMAGLAVAGVVGTIYFFRT